jgi:hypothetical protein
MGITESEYRYYLGTIRRLTAARPVTGSAMAEKLELYKIKAAMFEWERLRPPAGSTPPHSKRYFDLLDRVLTPGPVGGPPPAGPGERPTGPIPRAILREGDSAHGRR